jgi:hypothetical protein
MFISFIRALLGAGPRRNSGFYTKAGISNHFLTDMGIEPGQIGVLVQFIEHSHDPDTDPYKKSGLVSECHRQTDQAATAIRPHARRVPQRLLPVTPRRVFAATRDKAKPSVRTANLDTVAIF